MKKSLSRSILYILFDIMGIYYLLIGITDESYKIPDALMYGMILLIMSELLRND